MARHNIQERRAYIKSLLDKGEEINTRDVARMWDSSPPAIVADIAACQGEQDPYYKKVPQWVAQNQRAARLGIEGQLTEQDWLEVLERHGNACVSCGSTDDIVIDHITPLSRGGLNTGENIQPLCGACNVSKSNRTPGEWGGRKKRATSEGKVKRGVKRARLAFRRLIIGNGEEFEIFEKEYPDDKIVIVGERIVAAYNANGDEIFSMGVHCYYDTTTELGFGLTTPEEAADKFYEMFG